MGEQKRRQASDMSSYRFEQGPCLNCGKRLNGLTGPKARPSPGDIMMCTECHYVMEWNGAGFSELSAETMVELADHPELQKGLAITKAFQDLKAKGELTPNVRVVVLEALDPQICEDCGKLEECRPYGKKKPDGERMWVCMPCAEKDPAEMSRAFDERMEGQNPV
jgi:hypothetical protein